MLGGRDAGSAGVLAGIFAAEPRRAAETESSVRAEELRRPTGSAGVLAGIFFFFFFFFLFFTSSEGGVFGGRASRGV